MTSKCNSFKGLSTRIILQPTVHQLKAMKIDDNTYISYTNISDDSPKIKVACERKIKSMKYGRI